MAGRLAIVGVYWGCSAGVQWVDDGECLDDGIVAWTCSGYLSASSEQAAQVFRIPDMFVKQCLGYSANRLNDKIHFGGLSLLARFRFWFKHALKRNPASIYTSPFRSWQQTAAHRSDRQVSSACRSCRCLTWHQARASFPQVESLLLSFPSQNKPTSLQL